MITHAPFIGKIFRINHQSITVLFQFVIANLFLAGFYPANTFGQDRHHEIQKRFQTDPCPTDDVEAGGVHHIFSFENHDSYFFDKNCRNMIIDGEYVDFSLTESSACTRIGNGFGLNSEKWQVCFDQDLSMAHFLNLKNKADKFSIRYKYSVLGFDHDYNDVKSGHNRVGNFEEFPCDGSDMDYTSFYINSQEEYPFFISDNDCLMMLIDGQMEHFDFINKQDCISSVDPYVFGVSNDHWRICFHHDSKTAFFQNKKTIGDFFVIEYQWKSIP